MESRGSVFGLERWAGGLLVPEVLAGRGVGWSGVEWDIMEWNVEEGGALNEVVGVDVGTSTRSKVL